MKLRNQLLALTLGAVFAATAQAAPYSGAFNTGTAYDGLLTPLTGFDIYSNGAAAFFCSTVGGCAGGAIADGAQIDPLDTIALAVGDVITTYYQGVVNVINPGTSSPSLVYPGASPVGPGLYQITVAAMFQEVVLATGPFNGTFAPLDAGSRVSLFYDNNNTAPAVTGSPLPNTLIDTAGEIAAGAGYTDGLLIADGSLSGSLPTLITIVSGLLVGVADTRGPITALLGALPESIGFIPQPTAYQATTTLQLGGGISGFATSNFFDGANGWTPVAVNSALVVRADANVDLAVVPEPASTALLGIGLVGLAAIRRRRAA